MHHHTPSPSPSSLSSQSFANALNSSKNFAPNRMLIAILLCASVPFCNLCVHPPNLCAFHKNWTLNLRYFIRKWCFIEAFYSNAFLLTSKVTKIVIIVFENYFIHIKCAIKFCSGENASVKVRNIHVIFTDILISGG